MKFDAIIEILGEFGPYQKRIYYLVCLVGLINAFHSMIVVFTLTIPKHRCRLPDGYNDSSYLPSTPLHSFYLNHSIPRVDGAFSKCERYQVNLTTVPVGAPIDVNVSKTGCQRWVYDQSTFEDTFITENNMICDDAMLRSHANMLVMAGKLVGALVIGLLADLIGRKAALIISICLQIVSSLATAFSPNYIFFVVCRFFIGISGSGSFMSAFVIGMELVGPSKRTHVGMVIELFWCVGLFLLGLMAFLIRDWSTLHLVISIPTMLLVALFWFVPESPRWLVSLNKTKKADKILREAAKVNHVELPDKLFDAKTLEQGPQVKVWEMFTSPVLCVRSLIIFFNWMVITMVYYGLGLNVSNMAGNIYLNFTIANIVETVGYLACIFLLDRVGRKALHCSAMLLGGIACIATMFPVLYLDQSYEWVTITLSMAGKLFVSAAFGVVYIFSAELFPTVVRNSGMGTSSFCGRIGGIFCPYIVDLGQVIKGDIGTALPLIIFGGASVVAGLLSLLLPETLNKNLPETIQDAKLFGRKSNKSQYHLEIQEPEQKPGKYELQEKF